MKIAIVGGGISGLSCAYFLNQQHDVVVFEAENNVGGHTATKEVVVNNQTFDIDTGFIVFNDWTYPNFIKLMDQVGVKSQNTEMSFSVSSELSGLEYGGNNLNALFAQRRNLFSIQYLRMLWDIVRFNKEAIIDLENGDIQPSQTLCSYLEQKGYSRGFINNYLIPMGCAIWSSSTKVMMDFPVQFFIRFFKNHGLLSINNRPQWRVITGGSGKYLEPLCRSFQEKIRTHCPVDSVRRDGDGVLVKTKSYGEERFDQVIFACHSDQALSLLKDPTHAEVDVLSSIPYQENEVVLHTDTSLLPKKKVAWSSWNYLIPKAKQSLPILTYNMNILQGLSAMETFCVTLNATEHIDKDKILGKYVYSHPVFSQNSVQAAKDWHLINGKNQTWFCGAYWANGFHEDGVVSALRVANALGVYW